MKVLVHNYRGSFLKPEFLWLTMPDEFDEKWRIHMETYEDAIKERALSILKSSEYKGQKISAREKDFVFYHLVGGALWLSDTTFQNIPREYQYNLGMLFGASQHMCNNLDMQFAEDRKESPSFPWISDTFHLAREILFLNQSFDLDAFSIRVAQDVPRKVFLKGIVGHWLYKVPLLRSDKK